MGYDEFEAAWLEEFGALTSPTEKGKKFLEKFIYDWLSPTDAMLADAFFSDGAGDGGIDFAILQSNEDIDEKEITEEGETPGDQWFVVQSKYGEAYRGANTLDLEADKFFRTLRGDNTNLSDYTQILVDKLRFFLRNHDASRDRIILTFIMIDELNDADINTINKIRARGRDNFGPVFDVTAVSLRTIYNRYIEELSSKVVVDIEGSLTKADENLLIGSTSIVKFYEFLKAYRSSTNDLDRIFEKNVRKSLGYKVKVNKGIKDTLLNNPERFGLYNNGITIAVTDFIDRNGLYELHEPYIVNGCQTSTSIWAVCDFKLSSGGNALNAETNEWVDRAKKSHVVVKVAKVGEDGDVLLKDITRYTNSQNAVRDKDFIALSDSFQAWRDTFSADRNIFLEIQKGGWDAEKVKLRGNPRRRAFEDHANAVELMKVYGAGWMKEPGTAYSKNAPFVPGGSIYKTVTEGEFLFDAVDLYAAYLLLKTSMEQGFLRNSAWRTRKQTKYLFCFVLIYLFSVILQRKGRDASNKHYISELIANYGSLHAILVEASCNLVDEYLREDNYEGISAEERFERDLNNFLKSSFLGKKLSETKNLSYLLDRYINTLWRSGDAEKIFDDMNI